VTQVEVDQDHPLTGHGEGHGQIGTNQGLALFGFRARHDDGGLSQVGYGDGQIGPKNPKGFVKVGDLAPGGMGVPADAPP
jgi:hypothetical protein